MERNAGASGLSRPLIVLNVVLLGVLGVVTLAPRADAQAGAGRGRGTYTMVAGTAQTGNSDVTYIIDGANQELVAVRWDGSRKELKGVGYRDVQTDSKAQVTR
ncbi:MAG: hypothetical protein RBS39_05810 [Phycisphaerales bacterium]|jgi:hypothetical protein|nr:hypothetical protein [Phycisphaerales bacterium]